VTALVELPNGFLASSSGDATIRLWKLAKKTKITRTSQSSPVTSNQLNDIPLVGEEVTTTKRSNVSSIYSHQPHINATHAASTLYIQSLILDEKNQLLSDSTQQEATGSGLDISGMNCSPRDDSSILQNGILRNRKNVTSKCVKVLEGHTSHVRDLSLLVDSTTLVSACHTTIMLWDTSGITAVRRKVPPEYNSTRFTDDGRSHEHAAAIHDSKQYSVSTIDTKHPGNTSYSAKSQPTHLKSVLDNGRQGIPTEDYDQRRNHEDSSDNDYDDDERVFDGDCCPCVKVLHETEESFIECMSVLADGFTVATGGSVDSRIQLWGY
jgi:WD40 repeat protein